MLNVIGVQKIHLEFNPPQLHLVLRGLGKLPYDEVAPLMQAIQGQIIAQQTKKSAPAPVAVPDTEVPDKRTEPS